MKRCLKLFTVFLFLMVLVSIQAFSLGGKILDVPMKTYPSVKIKDGEFLHYGMYSRGEKYVDVYYVTIKEKNSSGGFYYRVYEDIIAVSGGRKLPGRYTDWPVSVLIDPVLGSTLESEGNLSTNELKDFASFGVGGLIYWHYQLYPGQGIVKYTSKSMKADEIITKNYRINVKPGFPAMDAFSEGFIISRFIDPHSPGIVYYVIPDFMKEPFPLTVRFAGKENITIKAGKFNSLKIVFTMGDPFIGKLMEPFMKDSSLYVDSERRIPIESKLNSGETILEEISNVTVFPAVYIP
jgi:hypothetical protein